MSEAKVVPTLLVICTECSQLTLRWDATSGYEICQRFAKDLCQHMPIGYVDSCYWVKDKGSFSAILWWLPRRCQIRVLWNVPPLTTNRVRGWVALALVPRVLRCNNRKLWRPTGATKIMCKQSAVPSSSDMFMATRRALRKRSCGSAAHVDAKEEPLTQVSKDKC